jgi:hypothetical protein
MLKGGADRRVTRGECPPRGDNVALTAGTPRHGGVQLL